MPRFRILASLMLAIFASLCTPVAMASMPCPTPPCDPLSAESTAVCEQKADWIVEGQVASVNHGTKVLKDVSPPRVRQNADGSSSVYREVLDFTLWDGGQVVLTKIQVIKGVVEAEGRQMTVRAASHCWTREAFILAEKVGHRVRVYGTENELTSAVLGPLLTPGIFAVQMVDGQSAR